MSLEEKEALKNIHLARGEMYSFFARVFSNVPDDDFYAMAQVMSKKLLLLGEETGNGDIQSGAEEFASYLEERSKLEGKELSEFDVSAARSYTFLFCLPKSIPVDESNYTSGEHRERDESWADMVRLFDRYGMQKTKRISENEDFISYELLFMAKLSNDLSECIEKGEDSRYIELVQAQSDFHKYHFDKWIPSFFGNVINSKVETKKFYSSLARIAYGYIQEDKAALKELV